MNNEQRVHNSNPLVFATKWRTLETLSPQLLTTRLCTVRVLFCLDLETRQRRTLLLLRAIQSRTLAFFLRVLKSFTPCNELCTPCNTMNYPYNEIAMNWLTRDGFNLLAHKKFGPCRCGTVGGFLNMLQEFSHLLSG